MPSITPVPSQRVPRAICRAWGLQEDGRRMASTPNAAQLSLWRAGPRPNFRAAAAGFKEEQTRERKKKKKYHFYVRNQFWMILA